MIPFAALHSHLLNVELLQISLITLFAGPLIYMWMSRGGRLAHAVDRLIVVALVLLVGMLLLPEIIEALGWSAIALVALGYVLPGLLEMAIRRAAETFHIASLVVALLGLLLHAALDGAGLAGSELGSSAGLGLAIVLHRFGEGLMIWLMMQPVFGARAAWSMLVVMAAVMVLGFEFSERLLPLAGAYTISVLQAVIIGTIIHSLVHREHVHTVHRTSGRS